MTQSFITSARYLLTSESVTEGHPDKLCDQISDAVLDAILAQDPYARVACETAVTNGLVIVMGEITTSCYVEIPNIVREVVHDVGYNRPEYGFDNRWLQLSQGSDLPCRLQTMSRIANRLSMTYEPCPSRQ